MKSGIRNVLQAIPKVDRIMGWIEIESHLSVHPRPAVVSAIRSVLDRLRGRIVSGELSGLPEQVVIVSMITEELTSQAAPGLKGVVNGTGVVIHTNLGRSPLADEAVEAVHRASSGYCNLEYRLESGERGTRHEHVESLVCELTGAEAALTVNNNAAAVILALSSMANGREVIVSRGELVEIGGSFRIPDVMRQSGARLVEVGTTNRTHTRDYLAAITDSTSLMLKVHTSNFAIVGFTAEASVSKLSALGMETGIPVMLDAGSGCLIDLTPYGIEGEPTIRQHLEDGADLVTFSGDKLLGGPQAGIIAGKRQFVEPMMRHPLLRALRMDKLNLAALEATLRLYRDEHRARLAIPTLRMLTMTPEQLRRRAAVIVRKLRRSLSADVTFIYHQGESSAGGGSFPLLHLPTTLIEVRIAGMSPQQVESGLRRATVPVIGRIHRDRFLLDVRTIQDSDIQPLACSLNEAANMHNGGHHV